MLSIRHMKPDTQREYIMPSFGYILSSIEMASSMAYYWNSYNLNLFDCQILFAHVILVIPIWIGYASYLTILIQFNLFL